MQRLAWVDTAKALLIFLVIVGHIPNSYVRLPVRGLIYGFHVPAFLVLTGFLLPLGFAMLPGREVWRRWIFVFLKAYAFFSVLSVLLDWGLYLTLSGSAAGMSPLPVAAERPADLATILGHMLYGVGGDHGGLGHSNSPLWYFPVLVTSLAGAWAVGRLPGRWLPWVAAALWAGLAAWWTGRGGARLPWCLDIAGFGAIFILAGQAARRHYDRIAPFLIERRGWLALAGAFALLIGLLYLNGSSNLNRANFGANPLLYVLAALAGTAATVAFSARLPATALATAISVNTLTIFALHIYVLRVLDFLPRPDSGATAQAVALLWALVTLIITLGIAYALRPVLSRYILNR